MTNEKSSLRSMKDDKIIAKFKREKDLIDFLTKEENKKYSTKDYYIKDDVIKSIGMHK